MPENSSPLEKSLERLYAQTAPDPIFAARLEAQLRAQASRQINQRKSGDGRNWNTGLGRFRRWGLELAAVVTLVILLVVSIRLLPHWGAPLPAAGVTAVVSTPAAVSQTPPSSPTPEPPPATNESPIPASSTSAPGDSPDAFALYRIDQPLDDEQMAGVGFAAIIRNRPALLTIQDLTAYHLERHAFELTPAAFERIKNLDAPVNGLPFVVTARNTPIYQGAFWPLHSSLSYDGLAIWLPPLEENILPIERGYPGPDFFSGPDNRAHTVLMTALHKAGLIDWEEWLQPPGALSGAAEVDAILNAIFEKDNRTLAEMILYSTIGCTTQDGLGGPPKCAFGQADGTPVEVLPVQGSEGHYLYPAGIDLTVATITNLRGLIAVFSLGTDAPGEPWWPAADYGLVFLQNTGDYPWVFTLYIQGDKIVRLENQPGEALAALAHEIVGEWLLPPFGWNLDTR